MNALPGDEDGNLSHATCDKKVKHPSVTCKHAIVKMLNSPKTGYAVGKIDRKIIKGIDSNLKKQKDQQPQFKLLVAALHTL